MERKVIVIVGPTCSGKTETGTLVAENIGGEIISADSRQIYNHLTIGTAKPSDDELSRVKHHFINVLEPDIDYNASKFEIDSLKTIEDIFLKGKTPVVVGGSGLYVRALIDGIMNTVETNFNYREELYLMREKHGNDFLYEELKKVDPVSAESMLPQNWKRVIRCLEVFHLTGEPMWKWQEEFRREINFEFVEFGLNWPREILYKNIEDRVDQMIENGLIDEVKQILSLGYSKELYSLNTVGYKEIISFLSGEITLERAAELIKRNTRRYAKKQLTWFRKDDRVNWISVQSRNDLPNAVNHILNRFKD
jgi:tRNA dimethylallyltransferase